MFSDPYKLLGIDTDADTKAVKSAFRARVAEHHPDRNQGDSGEEFRRLCVARDLLLNSNARAEHDTRRRAAQQEAKRRQQPSRPKHTISDIGQQLVRWQDRAVQQNTKPKSNVGMWFLLGGLGLAAGLAATKFAPADRAGRHRDRRTGQFRKGYFR